MTTIIQSKWLADMDGSYAVAANWSPAQIPTYNVNTGTEYDVTIGDGGTTAFTVTSAANETIGYLTIYAHATLAINAGLFTIDSKAGAYSGTSNYGTINVAAAAKLLYGAAGNPSTDSGELWNFGAVVLSGALAIAEPWFGLKGTGSIKLTGGEIISANGANQTTFVNVGNTISGAGLIGAGTTLDLINGVNGVINANASTALTFNTSTDTIENAGLIETTGAGGLVIRSNLQNDGRLSAAGTGALSVASAEIHGGGIVSVAAGASIVLNQGELSVGGVITIAATGKIVTTATNTLGIGPGNVFVGDVLNDGDVEDNGAIVVANNSTLNLNASVYGSGAIDLNGSTGRTKLEIYGNGAALDNAGGIVMTNSVENSIVANGSGVQLSNYKTIAGAGTIGDTFLRLFNSGTGVVDANASAGLTIVADAAALAAGSESEDYNAGTVEAMGGGKLTIKNGTFGNAGTLEAVGTGVLTLDALTIDGGGGVVQTLTTGTVVFEGNSQITHQAYLTVSSGGTFKTFAGDVSDAILDPVFNNGAIDVVANSRLIVDAHWQNQGAINIQGTTAAASIEIAAGNSWELLNSGTVNLGGSLSSIVSGGAGAVLENKGDTFAGSGVIGDANMTINNQQSGIINATGAKGLILDATASSGSTFISNSGIMESHSAGGLTIESAMYNGGKLIANTGGNIVAQGAVYGSGIATINGTGSIEFGGEMDGDVYFAAGAKGSLILDTSSYYGDTWGLTAGNSIDLRYLAFNAASTKFDTTNSGSGTLDSVFFVTNGTTDSGPLYLQGNFTSTYLTAHHLAFQFASDGHLIGGTSSDGTLVKLVSTA